MTSRTVGRNGPVALAFHVLLIVFITAPLIVVMLVSFSNKDYISMPFDGASLRWYREIFAAPELVSAFWLSIWLGLASATLASVVAIPAAIAIARHRFAGRDALMAVLMSPLMIPHVVLGVAFLRFFSLMDWTGSFPALVLVHAVVVVPYSLRLTLAAVIGLERDAESGARSLGASRYVAFRRILLPLILPGVIAGWLLAFIQSFDEVTMTIFVATPGTMTLPVAMYNRVSQLTDPVTTSVSTVLIIGTMMLMFALDRIVGLDRVLVGKS
ncbi:ABC transporter permease [Bradyrhizobium xenonodulans]|uniref:ABC transporter permease n=1 Tax=Bradyrhizobium xenonodulans TaxID=2736875 RepID=A0ABY7MFP8_9BRAD|nr:ABC transporter permease [Bradyrhizobium xenonodulans]WBL76771.1 ABC transporter permease [Bradyrhizobium xenonodulans]